MDATMATIVYLLSGNCAILYIKETANYFSWYLFFPLASLHLVLLTDVTIIRYPTLLIVVMLVNKSCSDACQLVLMTH